MSQPYKSLSFFTTFPRTRVRSPRLSASKSSTNARSKRRLFIQASSFPRYKVPDAPSLTNPTPSSSSSSSSSATSSSLPPPPLWPQPINNGYNQQNPHALTVWPDKLNSNFGWSTASNSGPYFSSSSTQQIPPQFPGRENAHLFSTHLPNPSLPINMLPSFFGGSISSPRRSYVFQHGSFGIPKRGHAANAIQASPAQQHLQQQQQPQLPPVDSQPCLSVQVGQDAYFVRTDALGIADGVGGWTAIHKGADPAAFASLLMHYCSSYLARFEDIEDELFMSYYDVDPVEVLHHAYTKLLTSVKKRGEYISQEDESKNSLSSKPTTATRASPSPSSSSSSSSPQPLIGSSTALIAVLRNDELRIANMGDCCLSVIRGNEYVFRSEEQQHSFNFPVQLGTKIKDTPRKDAQSFTVKVQKDDIVILSSDGLVDNLFDEDILEEVLRFVRFSSTPSRSPSPTSSSSSPTSSSNNSASGSETSTATTTTTFSLRGFNPQAVSEALCSRAKAVSEDKMAVTSPFQVRATDEGIHYVGGKEDDISVIVAVIGELEDSPDRR